MAKGDRRFQETTHLENQVSTDNVSISGVTCWYFEPKLRNYLCVKLTLETVRFSKCQSTAGLFVSNYIIYSPFHWLVV